MSSANLPRLKLTPGVTVITSLWPQSCRPFPAGLLSIQSAHCSRQPLMAPLDNDTESTIRDEILQEAWAPEITHQASYRYVLPSLRRNSITRLYLLKIELNKKKRYDDVHKQIMVTKRKRENHGSCSRCNENAWHIESNYILQPSKYLLHIINRFRYTNNNVTEAQNNMWRRRHRQHWQRTPQLIM